MSEDLPDSFSFIISSMSSLSDLLKNNVLELSQSSFRDKSFIRVKAPGLEDKINEIIVLFGRQARVNVSIVLDPSSLAYIAVRSSCTEELAEISSYGLASLFSSSHSGVGVGVVVFLQESERNRRSSSGDYLPGMLDDSQSLVDHVSLK